MIGHHLIFWSIEPSNPHPYVVEPAVSFLHLSTGHAPEDERAVGLVTHLRSESSQFRSWWDGFLLRRFVPTQSPLLHPTLGRLSLTFTSFVASALRPTDDPTVVVLQPAAGEATRRRTFELGESRA